MIVRKATIRGGLMGSIYCKAWMDSRGGIGRIPSVRDISSSLGKTEALRRTMVSMGIKPSAVKAVIGHWAVQAFIHQGDVPRMMEKWDYRIYSDEIERAGERGKLSADFVAQRLDPALLINPSDAELAAIIVANGGICLRPTDPGYEKKLVIGNEEAVSNVLKQRAYPLVDRPHTFRIRQDDEFLGDRLSLQQDPCFPFPRKHIPKMLGFFNECMSKVPEGFFTENTRYWQNTKKEIGELVLQFEAADNGGSDEKIIHLIYRKAKEFNGPYLYMQRPWHDPLITI